ncbi:hypothetical protein DFJ74DRAFT_358787 [Hyaloraphidium curvatum]|nr:hypothetical protein DFJ74DRAFT_358787 [Hyaloraphidium curvatum]
MAPPPKADAKKKKKAGPMFKTYYEVLNIEAKATAAEIKRAYRKEALIWHPDKQQGAGGDVDAANVRFRLIVEAYEVLSDGNKRRMYDSAGWTPGESPFGASEDTYRPSGGRGFDPMGAYRQWQSWAEGIDPDAWFGGSFSGFGGGFGGDSWMGPDWDGDPFGGPPQAEEEQSPEDPMGFYPPGFKMGWGSKYGTRPMEKPKDFMDPFAKGAAKPSKFGAFGEGAPKPGATASSPSAEGSAKDGKDGQGSSAANGKSGEHSGAAGPEPGSETPKPAKRKLKVKIEKAKM